MSDKDVLLAWLGMAAIVCIAVLSIAVCIVVGRAIRQEWSDVWKARR